MMWRRIDWSPGMLATLRRMRAAGHGLDAIATALGISKTAVMLQCDRIGLSTAKAPPPAAAQPPASAKRDWMPLPPGHPSSWGAISDQAWPQPGARAA